MTKPQVSRRDVLKALPQAGLLLAAANSLVSPAMAQQLERDVGKKPISALTTKFHTDGTVAYWPGNSIICHIDKRSESFMALLDVHRRLLRSGMTHRIAVLPPASYHMTMFNGVSYPDRHINFPTDIARDATEKFCNDRFLEKLKKFDLGCDLPLRMRALPAALQTNLYNILFEPADDIEAKKIRSLRDRLAAALNYRLDNHETYRFHITLNYFFSKMEPCEDVEFAKLHEDIAGEFIARTPVVELQNPEYVFFDDMYEFRRQLFLENISTKAG
jgi:hypothetical protein